MQRTVVSLGDLFKDILLIEDGLAVGCLSALRKRLKYVFPIVLKVLFALFVSVKWARLVIQKTFFNFAVFAAIYCRVFNFKLLFVISESLDREQPITVGSLAVK